MKKIILLFALVLLGLPSCVEMYLPPKNTVTDENLMTSSKGMSIYMARLYSKMPFEDFKYHAENGLVFSGHLQAPGIDGCGEAMNRDGTFKTLQGENHSFWGDIFVLLHDANHVIENLPNYRSNFSELEYEYYLGQAYFVRAYTLYRGAIRFGGLPLVTSVIKYPAESDELEVPRSTEEETWDQICRDFDSAIELLPGTPINSGLAGKYAALGFKAEAMLFAGSVAKYSQDVPGGLTGFGSKTGVRVIGFAPESAAEASKRYFAEAYKAAREVMESGKYSLYMKKWAADDKEAQYQNMVDMFSDLSSSENIFVKEYQYPTYAHGIDGYCAPFIFRNPLSAGSCPSLDFVELFDGFDKYADGTIRVTDGNDCGDGNYLMFDSTMDFFRNAEPRLRAYIIFPGDVFRQKEIEVRMGIYIGDTPVQPFFDDYSYSTAESNKYQALDIYDSEYKEKDGPKPGKTLLVSDYDVNQQYITLDGVRWPAAGANGPFWRTEGNNEATLSGFHLRKWMDTDPACVGGEGLSDQPFVLLRYADILLAAAEAGVELSIAGAEPPVAGDDMLAVATQAIRDIRERAGADQLTASLSADNESRDIVRRERRKELAFEHKTKWDIRRWRVQHFEGRNGFWGVQIPDGDKRLGNTDGYRLRGLYPFYSSKEKKYFFDANFQMARYKELNFGIRDYYFEIPSGEVAKSPMIDQQPNR